jgi:hypothetical protein
MRSLIFVLLIYYYMGYHVNVNEMAYAPGVRTEGCMKGFCGEVEGTRHREENYINIGHQEVEWVGKDCINLDNDRDSLCPQSK